MKKKLFFSLLLLTVALFLTLKPTIVSAASTFNINISVDGTYSNYYIPEEFTFTADYSLFDTNSSLTFIASSSESLTDATYQWKTKPSSGEGQIICDDAHLKLYKNINDTNISNITSENIKNNLILVGTSRYEVVITGKLNGETVSKKQVITVAITGLNETYSISAYTPFNSSANVVTKVTGNINLYSFLTTTKKHSLSWYFKSPNSSSYNLVAKDTNVFEFSPEKLITNENGYGKYKFYAKAVEGTSSKAVHYSDILEFTVVSAEPSTKVHSYSILSKEVKNSKTRIQAFVYSIKENDSEEITSANVLDGERIVWYVGDTLMARGATFKYEPTSTDVYDVTAKYDNYDNSLIELANYREEPSTTGLGILLLYVAIAVVALGTILTISIVVSNKKRDVVW